MAGLPPITILPALQGITIGTMMMSLMVMERQKALGIIPKYRNGSS